MRKTSLVLLFVVGIVKRLSFFHDVSLSCKNKNGVEPEPLLDSLLVRQQGS